MAEHQGPRRLAACKIVVGGLLGKGGSDVTSRLHPYLISVKIVDSVEGGHTQCDIELDDRNAELQLPPDNVRMQAYLGWAHEGPRIPDRGRLSQQGTNADLAVLATSEMAFRAVSERREQPWDGPGLELLFDGWVTEVESGFGRRGGGRRVWISATGGNTLGKTKETVQQTWGEGTPDDSQAGAGGGGAGGAGGGAGGGGAGEIPLHTVMTDLFKQAGMSVKLSPKMMEIKRKFWSATTSPMDFARNIAKEVGGTFTMSGGVAVLIGEGEKIGMPSVDAVWGVNLIGWRIKPYTGRPQYAGAVSRNFNLHQGMWEKLTQNFGKQMAPFGGSKAMANVAQPVIDKAVGKQTNAGQQGEVESRRGTGWVLLNGEPRAKALGSIRIVDARPGVDGIYEMSEVEHNYTRGVGYTTRANVKHPQPISSDYGWEHDPGNTSPKPSDAEPYLSPGTQYLPEADKEKLRQWYRDRDREIPAILAPDASAPPITQQSHTPEELERMRRFTEEQFGTNIANVLDRMAPADL